MLTFPAPYVQKVVLKYTLTKIFVYSLFSGASKGSTKAFKENKN